jgi:CheY-like chemotaxis protein
VIPAWEPFTARPVLVVEDSDEDFDTLGEAAQRAGVMHELRRAPTSDVCLTLLRGEGVARIHPALVLMDLNTPGTDGREALVAIKADPLLRALPVVVITTSSNPKDLAFCYQAGANAYHVKPVRYVDHIEVLLDVFAYWLTCVAHPDGARG